MQVFFSRAASFGLMSSQLLEHRACIVIPIALAFTMLSLSHLSEGRT